MGSISKVVRVAAAAIATASLAVVPASSLAAGGSTIGSAPIVVYGQQEFGNTATDNPNSYCNLGQGNEESWSFWNVPDLVAGDRVTIDFGGLSDLYANLYPAGTNDYNFQNANAVASANAEENQHGQILYTTPRDGTMPLEFTSDNCDDAGPYNFTAYLSHEIVIGVSAAAYPSAHATRFSVSLHSPDGMALTDPSLRVSFTLVRRGRTAVLGTVAAPFKLTHKWSKSLRGKRETVRVTVTGNGYREASRSITVHTR